MEEVKKVKPAPTFLNNPMLLKVSRLKLWLLPPLLLAVKRAPGMLWTFPLPPMLNAPLNVGLPKVVDGAAVWIAFDTMLVCAPRRSV